MTHPVTASDEAARPPRLGVIVAGSLIATALCAAVLDPARAAGLGVLALLMIAGAEHDSRTYLLPDWTTLGAALAGIAAAGLGAQAQSTVLDAASGAAVSAASLFVFRAIYGALRGREGLGLGDVKLAAAAGAWIPLPLVPACFLLAALAGLTYVVFMRVRGQALHADSRLPFGVCLCPAIWVSAFIASIPG